MTRDPLEWMRNPDGSLTLEQALPNKVTLTSNAVPGREWVRMEFRLANGSNEKLTGLRVQVYVFSPG